MSKAKPTPRVIPFYAHHRAEVLAWRVDFGDGSVIWTEHESTARLIVAAPELLEAAKALTEALRRYGGAKIPEQTLPMYALEKAITKVEGRE